MYGRSMTLKPCWRLHIFCGREFRRLPVYLPPRAEDVGVRSWHAGIDIVDDFTFVIEVKVGPGVLPPAQADDDTVIKAASAVRGIGRSRCNNVVTVVEVDP